MKLDRVTFTGADDTINPASLFPISQQFPHVEWGILFGGNEGFTPRFPSLGWVNSLLEQVPEGIKLCAHLCGKPVYRFLMLGEFTVSPKFKRCQLNFHGIPIMDYFPDATTHLANALQSWGGQFIFQCDGVNDDLVRIWVEGGLGVPLFDTSSGAGLTPEQLGEDWPALWKKPDGTSIYCGYAGGLGPNNTLDQLTNYIKPAVEAVDPDGRIWIDMETKVRGNGMFSLAKCEDVLTQVSPYVTT